MQTSSRILLCADYTVINELISSIILVALIGVAVVVKVVVVGEGEGGRGKKQEDE